jgi:hypothetical protein
VAGVASAWSFPAPALAQPGDGTWFPEQSGEPSEPLPRDEAPLPVVPPRPLEPSPAEPPAAPDPIFPVTFHATGERALVEIDGPGIGKPVPCSGGCTLALSEGTYHLRIQASRRHWVVPVAVREGHEVDVGVPSAGAHDIGVALALTGGVIVTLVGFYSWVILDICRPGSASAHECDGKPFKMEALPYVIGFGAAGALMTGIGIGLLVSTKHPSVELVPANAPRARKGEGAFVGIAPTPGADGSGLVLRSPF